MEMIRAILRCLALSGCAIVVVQDSTITSTIAVQSDKDVNAPVLSNDTVDVPVKLPIP